LAVNFSAAICHALTLTKKQSASPPIILDLAVDVRAASSIAAADFPVSTALASKAATASAASLVPMAAIDAPFAISLDAADCCSTAHAMAEADSLDRSMAAVADPIAAAASLAALRTPPISEPTASAATEISRASALTSFATTAKTHESVPDS